MASSTSDYTRHGAGLAALFEPASVAIVGASGRADNPFARPLEYLVTYGYEGTIHPINPGYETLHGLPCHPDLASVPEPIDLALLMVPAAVAVDLVPQVAAAGASAAVVFASGFGEAGPEGRNLQHALVEAAQESGVRILGPNCQGVLSAHHRMFGTFTAALELGPIRPGALSYVGQSGAVGGSILSLAREHGIGVSGWASTGNQADLTTVEVGRHLIEDEHTSALAMYLESAVDERDFLALATRAGDLDKSLIVLRSATSDAGAKAAASHTGAIVGDDAAFRAIAAEHGVIEAQDIDDLVRLSHAHTALPRSRGSSTVIVTTSGGAGSLAADKADDNGLAVPDLTATTQAELARVVPAFGAVDNPVDVTAQIFRSSSVDDFIDVCRIACGSDEVDSVAIVLTLVTGELAAAMASGLSTLVRSVDKPIVIVWSAAREQTESGRGILRDAGVPVFDSARDAMRVLATLRTPERHAQVEAPEHDDGVRRLIEAAPATLTESAAAPLLALAGIPTPRSTLVATPDDVDDLVLDEERRYVVKVQAPTVTHKTERGAVVLAVTDGDVPATVRRLFGEFADEPLDGVMVQEMVPDGVDLIVGVTRSGPSSLPLVTVGFGGVLTELVQDTATAVAPVSAERARRMVAGLRALPLLTGWRGSATKDIDALVDLLVRVGQLAHDAGPTLRELEMNPVRVFDEGHGVLALDVLVTREVVTA